MTQKERYGYWLTVNEVIIMKAIGTADFMQVTTMLLSLLKNGSRGCKEMASKSVILPSVIVTGVGNRT